MLSCLGKGSVLALGLVALSAAALPQSAQAASAGYCTRVAERAVANDHPRRGLLGAVITLPFDITGAVLTGYTSYDVRKKRVYNEAYNNCRGMRVASNYNKSQSRDEYCAARFRSYDPATGTYVTYDGRVVACR